MLGLSARMLQEGDSMTPPGAPPPRPPPAKILLISTLHEFNLFWISSARTYALTHPVNIF